MNGMRLLSFSQRGLVPLPILYGRPILLESYARMLSSMHKLLLVRLLAAVWLEPCSIKVWPHWNNQG
jgi:hypothetical protein